MTHNQKAIEKTVAELIYWKNLAKGGEAHEVAPATQRMAKRVVRELQRELHELVKEEVEEKKRKV